MVELILTKKTNVYNYAVSSSGVSSIGNLLRVDNERGYTLDLYENESIPITFQIADVKDPSIKKSAFSKNFLIPGTKRNSLALDFSYMMSSNTQYQKFNGQIVQSEWQLPVQEAQIYVDGILAFSGLLELRRAVIQEGEVNSFEVNFLATQINIFDELENKNMRELSMPNNFIRSGADINSLFNATSSDDVVTVGGTNYTGFTLAYPDWGFPGATAGTGATASYIYSTTDYSQVFRSESSPLTNESLPGLFVGYNLTQYAFVKSLVDKIFDGIDFSYSSDFFESDEFKKLLLLCYDSSQLPSNLGFKIFGSSPTSSSYYDDIIPAYTPFPPSPVRYTLENIFGTGTIPSSSPFDANEGLRDPFGVWDSESQTLTFTRSGNFTIQVKAVIDIRFGWDMVYNGDGNYCPSSSPYITNVYDHSTYPLLGPDSTLDFHCAARNVTVSKSLAAKALANQNIATPNTYTKAGGTHYQWEASLDAYTTPLIYSISAQAGDIWQMRMQVDASNYCSAPVETDCFPFLLGERKYQAAIDVVALDITSLYLNWNQTLPDISQKQFMIALIKHFNLYSEVSNNSRIMTFEPWSDFFNLGYVQDWTKKIDIGSVREIQRFDPPLEVFARMKTTENYLDVEVQNGTQDKLEYGTYQTYLTNGKEETITIQSDFGSTTPSFIRMVQPISFFKYLVQTSATYGGTTYTWNIPNPALFPIDTQGNRGLVEKSEMFLGYRPNIVSATSAPNSSDPIYAHYYCPGSTGFTGILYQSDGTTRAADHLWSISSIGSTGNDVNFAATRTAWLSGGQTPPVFNALNSNYEAYYQDFFANLNSQKILVCNVRLDTTDIANFSFRNPVWIEFPNGDGDYFIVSKIAYDPTTQAPSSVELLTFDKSYFPFSYSNVGPTNPGPDYPELEEDKFPPGYELPPDQGGGTYPVPEPSPSS